MFYDNYLRLCNSVGKSPTAVALDIGLKGSTVTRWKKGSIPTDATLQKIADYFHVSADCLVDDFTLGSELEKIIQKASIQFGVPYQELKKVFLSGSYRPDEGFEELNEDNIMRLFSKIYGQEKPAIENGELNTSKLPSNVFPVPKMRRIPIVGTIRAGMPIFAEENIEGYEYDDVPEGEDCFFLRVKGDSMMNARICDGDLVLIKRQPCADDGQIVACLVNGDEATLKRFYQQGDMVILKPENPAYNPIIVPCADFESGYARIIGIVTEVKFKV